MHQSICILFILDLHKGNFFDHVVYEVVLPCFKQRPLEIIWQWVLRAEVKGILDLKDS